MWEFCLAHSILLEASYLPGAQNELADHLSRSFSNHPEWSLRSDVTEVVFQQRVIPQVDLFMTRHNRMSPDLFPSESQPHVPLRHFPLSMFYAFPPIPLVHKVLLKIIPIALTWPHQHWFATLLDLLVASLIPLPVHPDLISQDHSCLLQPNLRSLHLTAWKLHG